MVIILILVSLTCTLIKMQDLCSNNNNSNDDDDYDD